MAQSDPSSTAEAKQRGETTVRAVSERVENNGSGYVVRAERISVDEEPALEGAGYHSETVLFTVFNCGIPKADHDPFRLVRRHFDRDRWILDELKRLKAELRESR